MFRSVALAGALWVTACVSEPVSEVAPPAADTLPPAYALSEKMQEARSYLFSHAELFLADPTSAESAGGYNQAVTMLGREDLMALVPEKNRWHQNAVCTEDLRPALTGIEELAKSHTLVIINESHSRPRHRVFIGEVVERLRAAGFTHYAAETLSIEGAARASGQTIASDGWYTHDPVHARMLEDIRASGMALVAYEQREDQGRGDEEPSIEESMARREEAQAVNLIEAVLGAAPETRMVVHVGYAHAEEVPFHLAYMAARLKEKTGIDPLTLDLTQCAPSGGEAVLTDKLSRWGKPASIGTDLAVRLPEVTFTQGRPNYRRVQGARDVPVPKGLKPVSGIVMIEARQTGEGDEIVPVDRLLLQPDEEVPLILPPGDYAVAAFDGEGLVAGPVPISVVH